MMIASQSNIFSKVFVNTRDKSLTGTNPLSFSASLLLINKKTRIRNLFPAKDMDTTEKHLGHPLIMPAKNRSSAYSFIVDKFITKLSLYKANRLSHAGRLTLIKSVFSSIPVYYMANILLSKKLIKRLTSVIRDFYGQVSKKETGKNHFTSKLGLRFASP